MFTVQVNLTWPLAPATPDCSAELTTPGPVRVAVTDVPDETVMSRCTWLWPDPMLAEVITGVGADATGVAVAMGVGVGVLKGVGLGVGNRVGTTNLVGVAMGVTVGIKKGVGVMVGNGVLDGVGKGVRVGRLNAALVTVGNTVISGGTLVTTFGTAVAGDPGAWVGSLVAVDPQPTAKTTPAINKPRLKTSAAFTGPVRLLSRIAIRL